MKFRELKETEKEVNRDDTIDDIYITVVEC